MNPLSDIGMPDWFWDKYRDLCTSEELTGALCGCGSGLFVSNHSIPIKTDKGISWTSAGYGFFDRCLACQTRLVWRVSAEAKGVKSV